MAIAYANKNYKDHDERWAAKREAIAEQEAAVMFRGILYIDKEPVTFTDEAEYLAALKEGMTTGIGGNDPKTDAMLKKESKKDKK